jgi:transcriptional regulator with XRE-family HTH domain
MMRSVSALGRKSIPHVSDFIPIVAYAKKMDEHDRTPLGWGARFRDAARAAGYNMARLAEASGWAESTIRSWTNGTRDINLTDFLQLCENAHVDPAEVLFGGQVDRNWLLIGKAWVIGDETQKGAFITVAKGILAEHGGSASKGRKAI